jgi:lantibiotic biosynthesis protein
MSRAAARAIAAELADQAIRADGMAGWSGATAPPALGQPAPWCVFGGDYYEGSAGIARFLAWEAGDDSARTLAAEAATHALARSEGWSLHSGLLGAGLVAREVAVLLDVPALWAAGTRACHDAVDAALADARSGGVMTDLLAGLAGPLHAAARLAVADPEQWRAPALALGTALAGLAQAAPAVPEGLAWPMHTADPQQLCGLAHGAAGVALAFGDLARIDPDTPAWPALAAAARAFERGHFHAGAASWADLRGEVVAGLPDGAEPPCPHFWCHGSVGITWERLGAHRALPACPLVAADLAAGLFGARREAVRILAGPVGPGASAAGNASQCHGLSGLIDLLLATGETGDRHLAERLGAFIRADAERGGSGAAPEWRCGLPGLEYSPGMMLGLAGIGWAQLQLAGGDVPPAWTPASPLACRAGPA